MPVLEQLAEGNTIAMGRHRRGGRSGGRSNRHGRGGGRPPGGALAFTGRPKPSLPFKVAKELGMDEQPERGVDSDDEFMRRRQAGAADAAAGADNGEEPENDGPGAPPSIH